MSMSFDPIKGIRDQAMREKRIPAVDQNGEPITPLDKALFDHYARGDFLVPQLRNLAHLNPHAIEVVEKAADRLERYEKALRDIVALDYRGNQPNEQRIATEALRGR